MDTSIFLTCALYLTIGEIGRRAGVTFAVGLSEKFGKRNTFIGSLAAVVILSIAIWFLPIHTSLGVWLLPLLQILVSLAFGVAAPHTTERMKEIQAQLRLKR